MEAKDLKVAVEELNKSGFLGKKLVLPKKDFVAAFMAAAEEADTAAEKAKKELPEETVKAYDLCKEEIKAAIPTPPEGAGKNKVEKKKPPTTQKKEKAGPKKEIVKSRYGHRVGSESATLDDLFYKGTTLEAATKVLGKTGPGRVKSHLQHLQKAKGLKIEKNDKGVYKVKA